MDEQRVQILNSDLTFHSTFGKRGSGKGQFYEVYGIACDSTGKVYVADSINDRIQVFSAEGKFLRMFGNAGEAKERLESPTRIAVDTRNMVHVIQHYKHLISVFSTDGQFVTSFSTRLEDEEETDHGPVGITVDSHGLVYVCDKELQKVKIF